MKNLESEPRSRLHEYSPAVYDPCMTASRRSFLGSSAVVFGSRLMQVLATPLWKWRLGIALAVEKHPAQDHPVEKHAARGGVPPRTASGSTPLPVTFVDVAQEAGLTGAVTSGAESYETN